MLSKHAAVDPTSRSNLFALRCPEFVMADENEAETSKSLTPLTQTLMARAQTESSTDHKWERQHAVFMVGPVGAVHWPVARAWLGRRSAPTPI